MTIRDRFLEVIEEKGIRHTTLAQAFGVTESYVSQMAKGKTPISFERIQQLCDFVDISVAEFFAPFDNKKKPLSQKGKALFDLCEQLDPPEIDALTAVARCFLQLRQKS